MINIEESIDSLGLSNRVRWALHSNGKDRLSDLLNCSEWDIQGMPNVGRVSVEELKRALAARGLTLMGEREPSSKHWDFSITIVDSSKENWPAVVVFSGTDETRRILLAIANKKQSVEVKPQVSSRPDTAANTYPAPSG